MPDSPTARMSNGYTFVDVLKAKFDTGSTEPGYLPLISDVVKTVKLAYDGTDGSWIRTQVRGVTIFKFWRQGERYGTNLTLEAEARSLDIEALLSSDDLTGGKLTMAPGPFGPEDGSGGVTITAHTVAGEARGVANEWLEIVATGVRLIKSADLNVDDTKGQGVTYALYADTVTLQTVSVLPTEVLSA